MSSSEVRFGVFIGGATYVDVVPGMALSAEEMGYDSFWTGEHVFIPSPFYEAAGYKPDQGECPYLESWTTISAISTITKRMRLGVAVTPIPMRHPGILAKIVATVDYISNGRVIFGVGAGWHEHEFKSYGIPYDDFAVRMEKTLEGVEIIKRLWTQPFTTFEGKYYRFRRAPLWPKPVQKPHPPIWFGGSSRSIMRAAAEHGQGWVPYCLTPEQYEEQLSLLRDMTRKAGREPDEVEPAHVALAYIASSIEEARETVEPILAMHARAREKPEEWGKAERTVVYGSPDDCIARIEEYLKAGVKHLLFEMISPSVAWDCIKLFGKKVLPYFKEKWYLEHCDS